MGQREIQVPDEPQQGMQVPAEDLLAAVRASRDALAYQVDFLSVRVNLLENQVQQLLKGDSDGDR